MLLFSYSLENKAGIEPLTPLVTEPTFSKEGFFRIDFIFFFPLLLYLLWSFIPCFVIGSFFVGSNNCDPFVRFLVDN